MSDAVLSKDIKNIYREILPGITGTNSALSLAGASAINWNTDKLVETSVPGASLVAEDGEKDMTGAHLDEAEVKEIKLVSIFPVTEETATSEHGNDTIASLVANAVDAIVKSSDIAIINGYNAKTGVKDATHAPVSILGDGTEVTGKASEDAWVTFKDAIAKSTQNNQSVLLSHAGFMSFATAQTKNDLDRFPGLSKNVPFTQWGINFVESDHATATKITKNTGEYEYAEKVLGYMGNFRNVYRAFMPVSIRTSTEGTIGGYNALAHNATLFIIEQRVKYLIKNPSKFTVIKAA